MLWWHDSATSAQLHRRRHSSVCLQGRDANRLLQRSIRAEDKKKKLPKHIARLAGVLDEWAVLHGRPFVLGALRYRDEVLALMEGELAEIALERPKKARRRRRHTALC
jgi:hypothetical protein